MTNRDSYYAVGATRKTAGLFAVAAVLVSLWGVQAYGLINPKFTPIQLVEQSTAIVAFDAGAPQGGSMAVANSQPLKGSLSSPPKQLVLGDAMVAGLIEDEYIFDEVESTQALLFVDVEKKEDGTEVIRGSLNLDGIWFSVERNEAGAWTVLADAGGMKKAIFNGHTHMLKRCVQYILSSDNPSVPVKAGVKWDTPVKVGQVEGSGVHCTVVDLTGDGTKTLFVASGAGDRAFRSTGGDGQTWANVTADLGLDSRSSDVACIDLNGDGRLDLASLTGSQLEIRLQTKDGSFAGKPITAKAEGVTALCALGLRDGHCGVVGAADVPVLYRLTDEKQLQSRPIVATPEGKASPGSGLGDVITTVAGDFDGDGMADLVQVFTEGALFYRRTGPTSFATAKRQEGLYIESAKTRVYTCDLDMDGTLDLALVGAHGFSNWGGKGDGTFAMRYRNGETDYIVKQYATAGAFGDFNNDGRQDMMVMYEETSAHPFFNRGFASMGFGAELDFAKTGVEIMQQGQQDGVFADVTGDGHQDFVSVLRDGTIWAIPVSPELPGLTVEVALSPDAHAFAPLSVTGKSEERSLGVRSLTPGSTVSFARSEPGLINLDFCLEPGKKRSVEAVVVDGPARITISPKPE